MRWTQYLEAWYFWTCLFNRSFLVWIFFKKDKFCHGFKSGTVEQHDLGFKTSVFFPLFHTYIWIIQSSCWQFIKKDGGKWMAFYIFVEILENYTLHSFYRDWILLLNLFRFYVSKYVTPYLPSLFIFCIK